MLSIKLTDVSGIIEYIGLTKEDYAKFSNMIHDDFIKVETVEVQSIPTTLEECQVLHKELSC